MEEVKNYLKENLKIHLHYKNDNTIVASITLEGEEITRDYIHYRIKK